jgi:hypothetical protein
MPGAPFYQPKLRTDSRERIQETLARIADFWKAIDHRIQRDVAKVEYNLDKHDITFHWCEMACRFTAMELDEIRLEITQSYGDGTSDGAMQPLDRNTTQAIQAAKNLFESSTSENARRMCAQFERGITFPKLRRQLQDSLDSINLKISIYIQANSTMAKK